MAKLAAVTKSGQTDIAYEDFLRNVKLFGLGLDSMNASLDRERYWNEDDPKNKNLVNKVSATYKLVDFSKTHFDISATFRFHSQRNDESPVLEIELTYTGHFHPAKGSFTESLAKKFTDSQARLIFWPYFRQTVSDITSRMYLPPITIPLSL